MACRTEGSFGSSQGLEGKREREGEQIEHLLGRAGQGSQGQKCFKELGWHWNKSQHELMTLFSVFIPPGFFFFKSRIMQLFNQAPFSSVFISLLPTSLWLLMFFSILQVFTATFLTPVWGLYFLWHPPTMHLWVVNEPSQQETKVSSFLPFNAEAPAAGCFWLSLRLIGNWGHD